MKEFWLAILKNVITYVVMIIIVIVGGISITTQKFPPDWPQIVSAMNTLKNGYVSMINLRQQLSAMPQGLQGLQGMAQSMPAAEEMEKQISKANAAAQVSAGKEPKDAATNLEMQTTLALLKSMSHQMTSQQNKPQTTIVASDPEIKKYLMTLEKQNQDMIEKMDKIQTYLAGLHQYLSQTAPRQPVHQSAVQQPPPTRAVASPQSAALSTTQPGAAQTPIPAATQPEPQTVARPQPPAIVQQNPKK